MSFYNFLFVFIYFYYKKNEREPEKVKSPGPSFGADMTASLMNSPETVTALALNTLGLPSSYFLDLIGLSPVESLLQAQIDRVDIFEWIAICDALHLSVNSLLDGYDREDHRARIRLALRKGYFSLPRTAEVQALMQELRDHRRLEFKSLARYYGFRLRWKIRVSYVVEDVRKLWNPNPTGHNPLRRIRLIARKNLESTQHEHDPILGDVMTSKFEQCHEG